MALTAPLLVTLLEGNIDADPFVQGMIREGCRLPYRDGLNRSLGYAALAPVALALPLLVDCLWPQRATQP
ncbi:hypothetical protein [Enterovirga rhinocerotis]|uniref:hypothetical protein n=1 Tax=Enterovirga rhinocerotis TaxID=1339210 RepID=UPI0010622DF0|nr:hypothetical protein [Enterovirga rhinocerotis]